MVFKKNLKNQKFNNLKKITVKNQKCVQTSHVYINLGFEPDFIKSSF